MAIFSSMRNRARLIGVLLIVAYSMLTYSFTKSVLLGVLTDCISGLAVIGIPIVLFPLFNTTGNKTLNYAYIVSRSVEGLLMVIGGFFILNPDLEPSRDTIYSNIHIYFFISGALFFYILFYRTQAIPKFISVWGILAVLLLLITTILRLFGVDSVVLDALLLPMILNEFFLAFWLILKGFNQS